MTELVGNDQKTAVEMKQVTLADVIGEERAFDTFKSASEVLFVYYLNKELRLYGMEIDMTKFNFIPELKNSGEVTYVANHGYPFIFDILGKDMESYDKISNKFFEKETVEFEYRIHPEKENTLIFSENYGGANTSVYCTASSTAYINVVARAFVIFFAEGKMLEHLVIDCEGVRGSSESFILLPMLQLEGNMSLVWSLTVYPGASSRAESETLYDIMGWVSYTIYLNQLGYGLEQSSIVDKYNLIKEQFPVGTVCWLYKKKIKKTKKQKGDLTKETSNNNRNLSITDAIAVVVRGYTPTSITLEKLSRINTRLGRINEVLQHNALQVDYMEMEQEFYNEEDITITRHTEQFNLATIGVEHYQFTEEHFIRKPKDNEKVRIWLYDEKGERRHELTTTEALYAMLEDWGIEYDKAGYLVDHMKNKRPYYEDYRQYNGEQA